MVRRRRRARRGRRTRRRRDERRAPCGERHARLASSPSGDVWVLAGGSLERFAQATPDPTFAWSSTLAPIFARVCASCHGPNGVSGVDLSKAAEWDAERDAIRARVVESKTMPPEGHTLSDTDRASIAAWANAMKLAR